VEFQQIYLKCLAQASYLIGDAGECAVVDPRRDVEVYLEEARARGLAMRHIIETHLHADFVSGHVELARRTGAKIHVSHRAGALYDHNPVREGDEIVMGDVVLRILETPGHTPESLCVLVLDGNRPVKLLTGDTLFIGDVGRPDLVSSKGFSARDMAGMMYDTLRNKLMALPDEVEVWPGHGAGSACGRSISSALSSTIGEQKQLNYALQEMTRDQFIELATAGLPPSPAYFSHDAELNRRGAEPLDDLPELPALSPGDFAERLAGGALVLDVRDKQAYGAGHLPASVNIGLGGSFASWCGSLLPLEGPLILVAEDEAGIAEARMRLARVGLHSVEGWLAGGIAAWRDAGRPLAELPQVEVTELARRLGEGGRSPTVLDVRGPGEHAGGHVPGAVNVPLPELEQRLGELDRSRPMAVICASGYRSSAACGLLRRAGFEELANVAGGTNAWVAAGFETETMEVAAG
jgi:glyoxylase-like metal-dependent hydrolase (beta-lactamase superfamily II)/rhodanese-related sulfurtransferase